MLDDNDKDMSHRIKWPFRLLPVINQLIYSELREHLKPSRKDIRERLAVLDKVLQGNNPRAFLRTFLLAQDTARPPK